MQESLGAVKRLRECSQFRCVICSSCAAYFIAELNYGEMKTVPQIETKASDSVTFSVFLLRLGVSIKWSSRFSSCKNQQVYGRVNKHKLHKVLTQKVLWRTNKVLYKWRVKLRQCETSILPPSTTFGGYRYQFLRRAVRFLPSAHRGSSAMEGRRHWPWKNSLEAFGWFEIRRSLNLFFFPSVFRVQKFCEFVFLYT